MVETGVEHAAVDVPLARVIGPVAGGTEVFRIVDVSFAPPPSRPGGVTVFS